MKRILLTAWLCLLSLSAQAFEIERVKLSNTAQVGAQTLVLNGAGVRTRFFIKAYVAALYLPQKQGSAAAAIGDERERRVALHLLRELSSERLLGAFDDAIKENHSEAELAALSEPLTQMRRIFGAIKQVGDEDVITLDYQPASGTQISLNGKVLGTITGAAFNRALLKIWLGNHPVQDDLKKSLLGG
jgi:hypothetical protein